MGLYGVTQMKSEYDPVTYMDALSYQRRYFDALEKYFPDAGERVEIYIGMNKSTIIQFLHMFPFYVLRSTQSNADSKHSIFYFIGDIEYWKFDEQLKNLTDEISNNPSVRNNSLNYWYTPFQLNCCSDPSSDCGTG